ncbi:hypothetical protein LTSEMIN_5277, partial [Salmonella enterica subsp. enterica serovar Minnesota str. A4-603]
MPDSAPVLKLYVVTISSVISLFVPGCAISRVLKDSKAT